MSTIPDPAITLGTILGRGQAFGLLANQGLASQADCLLKIRESGLYKCTGLSWDQFCPEFIGMSRQAVETLLDNLKEFGANYLRLSEIVRISPETYRQIQPKIAGEQLEIDGELVDIVPENTARIRQAVTRMRSELRKAKKQKDLMDAKMVAGPWMLNLKGRIHDNLLDLRRLADCVMRLEEVAHLRAILQDFESQLAFIGTELNESERIIRDNDYPTRPRATVSE